MRKLDASYRTSEMNITNVTKVRAVGASVLVT